MKPMNFYGDDFNDDHKASSNSMFGGNGFDDLENEFAQQ
jgi:hypothetical protein